MNNRLTAAEGEVYAKDYLIAKGYDIIALNEVCGDGEIDIIARDKDIIVFVEVKARENNRFGYPVEVITPTKKRNIIRSAKLYINRRRWYNKNVRFDVISLYDGEIEHIIDAFWIN